MIQPLVVKLPACVKTKQSSVVVPLEVNETGVKTRSAIKGKGKAGKGLKVKKSKTIKPSPDLPTDETSEPGDVITPDEPIEPSPVIAPQVPIDSSEVIVLDETIELTVVSSAVNEPNPKEFNEIIGLALTLLL